MPKVSIVMPLYNAAKYLEESLESVLCQSFADYELICIDDASTDGTMEILYKFIQKDNRIRIKKNTQRSGAAYSRNRGLHEARGNYVIFLDGDDIFDEALLERAVYTLDEYNADIVMYDFMHVPSENIYQKRVVCHGENYRQRYCRHTFCIKDNASYEFMLWSPATCNKMYRKDFLLENKLEFQDIPSANDVYFSYMALLLSERTIVMDDERVMVYARDHAEPSRISNNRDPMCGFCAMQNLQQELIKRNKLKEVVQHFYYQVYFVLKSLLFSCRNTERESKFYHFLQTEGMNILCQAENSYFAGTDQFINNRLNCFRTNSYQTKWYEQDSLLDIYLDKNRDMVCELFLKLKAENKKICIWGMGRHGHSLLKFLTENNIRVDLVVDKDSRKQGTRSGEYIISAPDRVQGGVDVIIISGLGIIEYVKEELKNVQGNFELIDINSVLGIT